jgi:hypothetical protein
MRYLFLLHSADRELPAAGTQELAEMYAAYTAATEAMARAGVLIDCAPLTAVDAATTVRVRGGETLLTDGPAAEIKEQVGGYTIVDCADLDEALRWAATLPAAHHASVEVRPIVSVEAPA